MLKSDIVINITENKLNNINSDKVNENEKKKDEHTDDNKFISNIVSFLQFLVFDVKWFHVIYHSILISASFYSFYELGRIFIFHYDESIFYTRLYSFIFGTFLALMGSIGLSAGCHRLWSHHAYKAKSFMRILLAIMFTSVAESTIYFYVKHHRAHHVYIDTHADPQNVKRGFWFAQLGWRLVTPRPEYQEKVKCLDFSDAIKDPVVKYQKIFFPVLAPLLAYILPTLIAYYGWHENWIDALLLCGFTKSCSVIFVHGLLGSVSHTYGQRTYNKKISATDIGLMSLIAAGEGYHNFHHNFPYDYSVSEFGQTFNLGKLFIDFMALFGQAYDLRKASNEYIEKAKEKALQETYEG